MTKITATTVDGVHILDCEGHASGSVEVCAAISALTQSLQLYLLTLDPSSIEYCMVEDGAFHICFRGNDAIFDFVKLGLGAIHEAEPEFSEFFLKN